MNKTHKPLLLTIYIAASIFTSPSFAEENGKPPNVVILIADDMGYGDIGAFGSEIKTPNIDRLAREGISLTNFHVGATCSPTRTMLISGVDNHRAGLGNMHEIMADNQFDQPGYEGHLNNSVVSIATILRDSGYNTYMAGKWHLGGTPESIPAARGFRRSFALAESGADNWIESPYAPMYERVHYFEDHELVSLPEEKPFSSDFWTQKIIDYIETDRDEDKPFLVWLGYQAVHYPHQAPKEFIDKYDGVYDDGWTALRRQRLERQIMQGIVPASTVLDEELNKTTVEDWKVPDWDALSDEEKRFNARRMQTYAGMLDNMDHNIGKLLTYLEKIGELDNTLVIFMADNGADPNLLSMNPAYRPWYEKNYPYTYLEDYNGDYSKMGQKGSYADYGPGWANAANSPHSYFKTFSTEGGLRVPFIARFPGKIPANRRSDVFAFVKDVYPTVLEMVGVEKPSSLYNGREIYLPSGTSAWGFLTGKKETVHAPGSTIGYELAGSSAVFRDNYKLSKNPPPKGTGEWELYDITKDPGEVNNLADENPELVKELIEAYAQYEKDNGVIPVPEGYDPLKQLIKNSKRGGGH
ncbi:sulfatase-like hydrolase/transferase [Cerasicoccus maritimus]|uniref:sulfatase-like hydrolase/transferase n=1 Tax=Cerasicoccus maritimus TaxID=490089 RepID=UPI002852CB56|nr:sulfatase-like hydrolase/transferase [Cerasicoccus maritimus]